MNILFGLNLENLKQIRVGDRFLFFGGIDYYMANSYLANYYRTRRPLIQSSHQGTTSANESLLGISQQNNLLLEFKNSLLKQRDILKENLSKIQNQNQINKSHLLDSKSQNTAPIEYLTSLSDNKVLYVGNLQEITSQNKIILENKTSTIFRTIVFETIQKIVEKEKANIEWKNKTITEEDLNFDSQTLVGLSREIDYSFLSTILNGSSLDFDAIGNLAKSNGINFSAVGNYALGRILNFDSQLSLVPIQETLSYESLLNIGQNEKTIIEILQSVISQDLIPIAWLKDRGASLNYKYLYVLDDRNRIYLLDVRNKTFNFNTHEE